MPPPLPSHRRHRRKLGSRGPPLAALAGSGAKEAILALFKAIDAKWGDQLREASVTKILYDVSKSIFATDLYSRFHIDVYGQLHLPYRIELKLTESALTVAAGANPAERAFEQAVEDVGQVIEVVLEEVEARQARAATWKVSVHE